MQLNLTRPLVFFDIESTGLNIASDCIAELSFVKVFPGGEQRIKTWRVCPWDYEHSCQKAVNPSASAVNGLRDEDLRDCPKFYEIVDEVVSWLMNSDLSGFNSSKFDLPMLAEEFERVRCFKNKNLDIDLHKMKMVDVQNIYHTLEPRNLKAAYKFYCGGADLEKVHTAEADTIATYEVLKGQLARYPETLKNDVDFLSNFAGRPKTVDYAGRLIFNEKKEPVISFGKHKGKTAREVYLSEPSYFSWILQGEFTLDTKRQFTLLKDQYEAEKRQAQKQAQAARSKPLDDKGVEDAAKMLREKFTGKLF